MHITLYNKYPLNAIIDEFPEYATMSHKLHISVIGSFLAYIILLFKCHCLHCSLFSTAHKVCNCTHACNVTTIKCPVNFLLAFHVHHTTNASHG
jgi:hypothetical protein